MQSKFDKPVDNGITIQNIVQSTTDWILIIVTCMIVSTLVLFFAEILKRYFSGRRLFISKCKRQGELEVIKKSLKQTEERLNNIINYRPIYPPIDIRDVNESEDRLKRFESSTDYTRFGSSFIFLTPVIFTMFLSCCFSEFITKMERPTVITDGEITSKNYIIDQVETFESGIDDVRKFIDKYAEVGVFQPLEIAYDYEIDPGQKTIIKYNGRTINSQMTCEGRFIYVRVRSNIYLCVEFNNKRLILHIINSYKLYIKPSCYGDTRFCKVSGNNYGVVKYMIENGVETKKRNKRGVNCGGILLWMYCPNSVNYDDLEEQRLQLLRKVSQNKAEILSKTKNYVDVKVDAIVNSIKDSFNTITANEEKFKKALQFFANSTFSNFYDMDHKLLLLEIRAHNNENFMYGETLKSKLEKYMNFKMSVSICMINEKNCDDFWKYMYEVDENLYSLRIGRWQMTPITFFMASGQIFISIVVPKSFTLKFVPVAYQPGFLIADNCDGLNCKCCISQKSIMASPEAVAPSDAYWTGDSLVSRFVSKPCKSERKPHQIFQFLSNCVIITCFKVEVISNTECYSRGISSKINFTYRTHMPFSTTFKKAIGEISIQNSYDQISSLLNNFSKIGFEFDPTIGDRIMNKAIDDAYSSANDIKLISRDPSFWLAITSLLISLIIVLIDLRAAFVKYIRSKNEMKGRAELPIVRYSKDKVSLLKSFEMEPAHWKNKIKITGVKSDGESVETTVKYCSDDKVMVARKDQEFFLGKMRQKVDLKDELHNCSYTKTFQKCRCSSVKNMLEYK